MTRSLSSLALLLSALLFVGCGGTAETNLSADGGQDDHGDHDHDGDDHEGHDHDGHDHDTINASEMGLDVDALPSAGEPLPETYAESLTLLAGMVKSIGEGLGKGDVDSIHDELHDIPRTLDHVEDLAEQSEQGEDTMAAVEKLYEAYDAIDLKLHGGDGKDYDEVKDDIAAAIETLQGSVE